MRWIQLIFSAIKRAEFSWFSCHKKWAEIRWFSCQEYKLNSVDFLNNKTSWIQLIFQPRKWAKIGWFSSLQNELNSVDFSAKGQLVFLGRNAWKISPFSRHKICWKLPQFLGAQIHWKRELIFIRRLFQKNPADFQWISPPENGLIINKCLS